MKKKSDLFFLAEAGKKIGHVADQLIDVRRRLRIHLPGLGQVQQLADDIVNSSDLFHGFHQQSPLWMIRLQAVTDQLHRSGDSHHGVADFVRDARRQLSDRCQLAHPLDLLADPFLFR